MLHVYRLVSVNMLKVCPRRMYKQAPRNPLRLVPITESVVRETTTSGLCVRISSWNFVLAPSVEHAREPLRFAPPDRCHHLPGSVWLFHLHVAHVDLRRLVSQLDFHLASLSTEPEEDDFSGVNDHHVLIVEIVLKSVSYIQMCVA